MPESTAPLENRNDGLRRTFSLILVAIGVGGILDLVLDNPDTLWSAHVLFELGLLGFSLGSAAYLWLGWRRTGDSLAQARLELHDHATERDAWKGRAEKLLLGLGEEIDRQLREWSLTPVERETALLILKGFGHQEIAGLQAKSERTVRQHAISIYKKSGLSGRAELSAFFLEDLLLPAAVDPAASTDPSEPLK